jgi:ParB/RepB/Spo0J family partition protein
MKKAGTEGAGNREQNGAARIETLGLDCLLPSESNARKTYDQVALHELADSIGEHGILNPLVVRELERPEGWNDGPRFEIVCGHRRYRAATLAGLHVAPCEIRELDDDQAREVGLIDNLQREDVPPMEEAEAFGALLDRMTGIPAVSLRVGKDLAYVTKRLKLRSLGVWSRDALNGRLITIEHALLLARLGVDDQDKHLKWCLDPQAGVKTPVDKVIAASAKSLGDGNANRYFGRYWEPQSVLDLKQHIEEHAGRKLSRAPWDLDASGYLPDAGACADCPSNTKANTALFSDLDIEEATCADGGCFELKRQAFVEIQLRKAGADPDAKPPRLVPRLSWKPSSVKPKTCFNDLAANGKMATSADPKKILRQGQWVQAKKGSCPNVRPGVTVDWSDDGNRGYVGGNKKLRKPGETLLVCIACGCKAHKKEYEKTREQGTDNRDQKAEAEQRAKRKAAAIEESKLRMAVASEAVKGVTKLPADAVRALAQASLYRFCEVKIAEAVLPGFRKTLQVAKIDSAEFAKAFALVSLRELAANEWGEASNGRADFLASVKRLGWTGPDPWKKPAAPKAAKKPAKKAAKKSPAKKAGRK